MVGSDVVQLEQVTAHFEGLRLSRDVQELPLSRRGAARNGSGLSFRRTARRKGGLQFLELQHCGRILLCCRGALIQGVGVRAASRLNAAGNRICFLR